MRRTDIQQAAIDYGALNETTGELRPNFASWRQRPSAIIYRGVVPAGQSRVLTAADQIQQGHRFFVYSRTCEVFTTVAIGAAPAGTPLADAIDPSPVAGTGNAYPHKNHVLFRPRNAGTDLHPDDLPFSLIFGDARDPNERQLADFILTQTSSIEWTVTNRNPTYDVEVFVALHGILQQS